MSTQFSDISDVCKKKKKKKKVLFNLLFVINFSYFQEAGHNVANTFLFLWKKTNFMCK